MGSARPIAGDVACVQAPRVTVKVVNKCIQALRAACNARLRGCATLARPADFTPGLAKAHCQRIQGFLSDALSVAWLPTS